MYEQKGVIDERRRHVHEQDRQLVSRCDPLHNARGISALFGGGHLPVARASNRRGSLRLSGSVLVGRVQRRHRSRTPPDVRRPDQTSHIERGARAQMDQERQGHAGQGSSANERQTDEKNRTKRRGGFRKQEAAENILAQKKQLL